MTYKTHCAICGSLMNHQVRQSTDLSYTLSSYVCSNEHCDRTISTFTSWYGITGIKGQQRRAYDLFYMGTLGNTFTSTKDELNASTTQIPKTHWSKL